ncbi:MAG: hypothetical protein J6A38_05415 [Clostridia bacterium]|nr:hypothetical protein [Clostridia bacterium]
MKKIRKSIVACLCATLGFGAIGLGVTLGTVASGEGGASVDNRIKAYYIEGDSRSSAVYGSSENAKEVEGVLATVYPKDKLIMREVVDLNTLSIGQPFVSVIPAPERPGEAASFGILKIDIVDVFDESNFVTARLTPYPNQMNTADVGYMTAYASNGQKPTGKDRGGTTIHVDNDYGSWVHFKFQGTTGSAAKNSFGFSYDNETNALYAIRGNDGSREIVADLDDPDYFGSNLFKGFTTGEVYCRVYAEDLTGENAQFIVNNYAGRNLSESVIVDATGPKIDVDFGEYTEEDYPDALVGFNYPLFSASAFDTYTGVADVNVKVYMNYFSASKTEMPVKKGGYFQPQIPGTYYAVYSATDENGNTAERAIQINALSKSADQRLNITLGDYEASTVVGAMYYVPEYTVSGEFGNYDLEITAKIGNESVKLETMRNTLGFRPIKAGTMTITYKATDFVGQEYVKTIDVTVNETTKPTFIETPVLPFAMIEGNTYTLPVINAYNYIDGSGAVVPTTIKVKEKGETKALNGNKYTPAVATSGDMVEIIYEAQVGTAVETYTQEIPVFKVNNADNTGIDMSKYFMGVEGAITATNNSLQLTTGDNYGVFTYLVAQHATSFTLDFTATATTKNATAIRIMLADYYDVENQICFNYEKRTDGVYFFVNDNYDSNFKVTSTFGENAGFNIDYDNTTRTVKYDIANNRTLDVTENTIGEEFNGFAQNKYYVAIQIVNATEGKNASISLTKMNAHTFSNATVDFTKPMISINGDFGGDFSLNDTFVLPEVFTSDVLCGDVDAYLTVTSPSGEIVTSVEGIKLENLLVSKQTITIKCSEYGTYFVSYFAEDSNNRKLNYSYTIRVVDSIDPTIDTETGYPETVTVGSKIHVPKAIVADNYDTDLTYVVYIVTPTGYIFEFDQSKAGFIASLAGEYNIIYSARDAEGNLSVARYTVVVTEA